MKLCECQSRMGVGCEVGSHNYSSQFLLSEFAFVKRKATTHGVYRVRPSVSVVSCLAP